MTTKDDYDENGDRKTKAMVFMMRIFDGVNEIYTHSEYTIIDIADIIDMLVYIVLSCELVIGTL